MISRLLKGLLLAVPLAAVAAPQNDIRALSFQYNEHVYITISNQPCPWPEVRKKYPLGAFAIRDDQQIMPGCYTHRGDTIVIQWYKGDTSEFPANYFLQGNQDDKQGSNESPKQSKEPTF